MNPLFELVTITPEFDFNQLEDEKEYDFKLLGKIQTKTGLIIKNASPQFMGLMPEIYLPHTEEKKVSEDMFTKEKVIELIDEILEYADQVSDAIHNENTLWNGETLLELTGFKPTFEAIENFSPPSSQVSKGEENEY